MAEGVDGAAVIHKRHTILELSGTDPAVKAENDLLAMLYRRHVEFAVGHGIGVHVDVSPDPNHAVRVRTKVVPSYEIPKTTPPRPEDAEINPAFAKLEGLVLDMKLLAEANPKQYRSKFKPLVEAYQDWIDREEKRITDPAEGLANFKNAAQQAIARCRSTLKRIEAGLDLLDKDDKAAQAFQFMNRAMWLQRTHSLFAERVRRGDEKPDMGTIDIAENRSWYPFQLAFILLEPAGHHEVRSPRTQRSPGSRGRSALVPHGRWKDGSVPGPDGLHAGPAAAARDGRRSLRRKRRHGADAVHAAAADAPAVPASRRLDLRLRGHSPHGHEQRRQSLGQDAVPHRPLGRRQHHAQLDQRCR